METKLESKIAFKTEKWIHDEIQTNGGRKYNIKTKTRWSLRIDLRYELKDWRIGKANQWSNERPKRHPTLTWVRLSISDDLVKCWSSLMWKKSWLMSSKKDLGPLKMRLKLYAQEYHH
jgi:hypothetical protein